MTVAVQRLNEGVRAALVAHFLALPMKNRCLRFATSLAPRVIAAYVNGIDFGRDAVFGVHDDQTRSLAWRMWPSKTISQNSGSRSSRRTVPAALAARC